MGKLTYYDLADEDMKYLISNYQLGQRFSAMTSLASNIIERYLKHILQEFCTVSSDVLRTHSLNKLLNVLQEELPDFKLDKSIVLKANGFYFNTHYPGDDAFLANEEDVENTYEAAVYTKQKVDEFLNKHDKNNSLEQMDFFSDLPKLE